MVQPRDTIKRRAGLLLLLLLPACGAGPGVFYANFRALPGERWERDSVVAFNVEIPRPGRYSFTLHARHTMDVRQANVACSLTLSRRGETLAGERVELLVVDGDGRWTGGGASLKTVRATAGPPLALDSVGLYRVEIRHRMKEKVLKGIKDIGIQVHGEK
ncbi:MAG: gliding motility lipoprotein GldH [Odoribacteraceae bacterium]|jgi:gliding motility-associated lipoprotein GldH|nr:gliding motility lipoprotein GldH [Odoribacteraceae bacterium]